MRLGGAAELPSSAEQVCSPYDPEARYNNQRDPACKAPHVITKVETTPATTPDDNMVAIVHQSLETRGLLPGEHLVDKGYTGSHVLVDSRRYHGVIIVDPGAELRFLCVADDPSWQARLGLLRPRCIHSKREPRVIGLQAREQFEALQGAPAPGETQAFRECYTARAEIEGTHAQASAAAACADAATSASPKRACSMFSSRCDQPGQSCGGGAGTPVAKTRCSRFAALQAAA